MSWLADYARGDLDPSPPPGRFRQWLRRRKRRPAPQVATFRTYETLRRVVVAGTWCLVGAAVMGVYIAFEVVPAIIAEADIRIGKASIVTVSEMDALCLEWRQSGKGWKCVRR